MSQQGPIHQISNSPGQPNVVRVSPNQTVFYPQGASPAHYRPAYWYTFRFHFHKWKKSLMLSSVDTSALVTSFGLHVQIQHSSSRHQLLRMLKDDRLCTFELFLAFWWCCWLFWCLFEQSQRWVRSLYFEIVHVVQHFPHKRAPSMFIPLSWSRWPTFFFIFYYEFSEWFTHWFLYIYFYFFPSDLMRTMMQYVASAPSMRLLVFFLLFF